MSDNGAVTVGVIGLGAIGAGVSWLLADKGYAVRGFDVRPEPLDALAELGGTPCGTPAEVADGAACVLVAVFDDAQLVDVLESEHGVFAAAEPAPVLVVLSTVTADTVRQVHDAARERGIAVLDCGVSGGTEIRSHRPMAASVGGDEAAYASVRPILETFGSPAVYMGPSGTGMKAKIARNMLHYSSVLADFEALRLASGAGLELEAFRTFVKAADANNGGRMKYGLDGDPHTQPRLAEYAAKDLAAAMKLAREVGVELPEATLATGIYTDVLASASGAAS